MLQAEQILLDIQQYIPEWKQVQTVTIKRMLGITNQVFLVEHIRPNVNPKAVIYRLYGESKKNVFLNRELEIRILKCLGGKCGPRIFGCSDKLRIQEYFQSSPCTSYMMLEESIIDNMAYKLRRLHEIDIVKSIRIANRSIIEDILDENSIYMKSLQQKIKQTLFSEQEQIQVLHIQNWIKNQIPELRKITKDLNQSEIVLSHNDLLANNILKLNSGNGIQIIDYEYSRPNYRAFDLANYLNQSLVDYDHPVEPFFNWDIRIPNIKKIQSFARNYLIASKAPTILHYDILKKGLKSIPELQAQINQQMPKFMHEIKQCFLLCNFFWGIWAVLASKNPLIDFDYILYADYRRRQYEHYKQNLKFK